MSQRAALMGALLATLATPATWPLALAGFLLRGGLVLVVLPIVVLPSPVGLGNLLAPTVMAVVFDGVTPEVAAIATLVLLGILTWILAGGLVAAATEADAVRLVAAEDISPGRPDRRVAASILAARLLAHAPTAAAVVWGSIRLVEVAYRELTSPADVTVPIVLRVVAGSPEVVTVLVLAWTAGEIVGGLASRRIVLDAAPVTTALADAVRATARHPLEVLAGFAVPLAGLVLILLPSTVAAAVAWSAVRVAMRSPADLVLGLLAVLAFVSLWIVGLVLIAVIAAWRAAVWSVAYRGFWARPALPATPDPA